jgi:cytochrome c
VGALGTRRLKPLPLLCFALQALLLAYARIASPPGPASRAPAAGENIYLNGTLASGAPLLGERGTGPAVQGAAAACVNCHRRSGLGETEGEVLVPPIVGRYLYRPRNASHTSDVENAAQFWASTGARPGLLPQNDRRAYTDTTLVRAIREGVGPDGRELETLMPRYALDDADMASLIAYLKQLSRWPSPGVGDVTLQFATIITPGADPIRRKGMLDVLEHFFGKQNVFYGGKGPPAQYSHSFAPILHRWQLHVWELTGAPDSWEAQLDARLKHEPVFAVISGVGGRTWEPVHRFCERAGLPCLFPNVDLPVVDERDFYDVYFSKGVLLEAQLIATQLGASESSPESANPLRRLVQVYRRGDIGEQAAAQLRRAWTSRGGEATDRGLDPGADAGRLRRLVADAGPADLLVLWLRPGDLESLPPQPPRAAAVFVSGIMGGLERAPLPASWRPLSRMTYPFELPSRRQAAMDYPLGWMRFTHVPVVDERTQADTYIACIIVSETVKMMAADLVRDHLVEALETHLGTRLVNGEYPRLSLAVGQRFASKGGYLVRWSDAQGAPLMADGDWSVP